MEYPRPFLFPLVWLTVSLLTGCASLGRGVEPAWIQGKSREYPPEQYLLGVGQAESKTVAVERAYAAVARIFRAEVHAQSRDWESFLLLEKRGQTSMERRLTLDQITKVSTDKVLENVRVLESWQDPKAGHHYALAGMDRAQAGAALLERIAELDQAVETELAESRRSPDKLARVRHLRRAIKDLVLREAYNTDLRVIRSSGHGIEAAHRVPELTAELEQFLAESLVVGVAVKGEQAEQTRRAVIEGLIREGLRVTAQTVESAFGPDGQVSGTPPELLVNGTVSLWDISVPDPRFRFVRWCGEFVIIELSTQRVVGAVSLGGREGHLTVSEARAKAFRIMQQELTSNLAKTLAAYIYGDTDPPSALPPSSCPKKDEAATTP